MPTKEQLEEIQTLLETARAQLNLAKQEVADLRRAGLEDEAKEQEEENRATEISLTRMESVYGRKS